ncbi:POLD1 [Scenedesmus sp. PABB004]|nr:POLD1 [Scenedesmus sp. PABB004]
MEPPGPREAPAAKRPRVGGGDAGGDSSGSGGADSPPGLALMLTDVTEASGGTVQLWGKAWDGRTALVVVPDYAQSFWLTAPTVEQPGGDGGGEARDPEPADLERLRVLLNARLPADCRVSSLCVAARRPIMFYRPDAPRGAPVLRLVLEPGGGGGAKKAAGHVERLAGAGALEVAGFSWRARGCEAYDADVKPLTRFLCETSLSGGSWLWVGPPAAETAGGAAADGAGGGAPPPPPPPLEWVPPGPRRRSTCDVEVVAGWRCLHSLTPDATQLAEPDWRPPVLAQLAAPPPELVAAAAAAAAGDIAPLKLLVLDVLLAPADGAARSCDPTGDPVVAIACQLAHAGGGAPPRGPPRRLAFVLAGAAALAALPRHTLAAEGVEVRLFADEAALLLAWRDWTAAEDPDCISVFQVRDTLGALAARFAALGLDGGACHLSRAVRRASRGLSTKSVVMYNVAWVKSQSRMASTSNQETFRAEGLQGRMVLDVLRQVLTSQGLSTFTLVDCAQSLLDATLEVLPPHVLAGLQQQLAATPPPAEGGGTCAGAGAGGASPDCAGVAPEQLPFVAAGLRLARHAVSRCAVVSRLLDRLASVADTYELARATGLTLNQVLYQAQMIRTWSLLLRCAARRGFIISGRTPAASCAESPFLLHPIDAGTAGLYRTGAVATLDFASLYPSLYRAHNLCYTTLLHPDDVARLPLDEVTVAPTGAAFVKPSTSPGVLPSILSALVGARATTRAALKAAQQQLAAARERERGGGPAPAPGGGGGATAAQLVARAAVLDGRQKALKTTANALYGFTGAGASMLQCVPLADACLALGAAACRGAIETITAALRDGALGPCAAGGRVIYAQTDSVFVHLPAASPAEAVPVGEAAAALVTRGLPPPMELKFERVCAPFMLLHVNRYAGRSFSSAAAAEAGAGELLIKGVKAVWRQSAPLLQTTLTGAVDRIVMHDDVPGAVSFAQSEIARLLSGDVRVDELAMTGGLWRVTGDQLEAAAHGGAGGAGGGEEEVKGPHASLAVRLSQRDPRKRFVLGERLSYVLLAGAKTQDDAAEDPLTAALAGLSPNYSLYWTNKLQAPLKEIFATVLAPAALQALLTGPHTQLKAGASVVASDLLPAPGGGGGGGAGPSRGAGASPGRGGRGGRGAGRAAGGGKQQGNMKHFFATLPQCLACKRAMRAPAAGPGAGGAAPGLCDACAREPGTRAAVLVALTAEAGGAAARLAAAHSACRRCGSGCQFGAVLCENGECPVMYARLASERAGRTAAHALARLDW